MIPAFSACTESPEPGISTSTTVSAIPITSTSLWPAPTGLEEDESLPAASSSEQRLQRRLGEAAEVAARAHRADEDAGIEEVVGEPDAVAEQRALRERARRVDRDRRRSCVRCSRMCPISVEIRLDLPTPGGPVTPTAYASAGLGIDVADEVVRERVAVLDERDRPRERAADRPCARLPRATPRPVPPPVHCLGGLASTLRWTSAPRREPARRRRGGAGEHDADAAEHPARPVRVGERPLR